VKKKEENKKKLFEERLVDYHDKFARATGLLLDTGNTLRILDSYKDWKTGECEKHNILCLILQACERCSVTSTVSLPLT